MNISLKMLVTLVCLSALAMPVHSDDRPIAGHEQGGALVMTGAKDTITAPGRIWTETGEDMSNFGAGGIVTGPVIGGLKGAGQALRGTGRMMIGILDFLTAPIREASYNRSQPGGLR